VVNFQSRKQPKVTLGDIRRVLWLGDDRNVFLGEELLHNKRCVARCVIVMQKALSLPLVTPLPRNCIALTSAKLALRKDQTLFRQYELRVQQTDDVK
jgi:hypothetical protein